MALEARSTPGEHVAGLGTAETTRASARELSPLLAEVLAAADKLLAAPTLDALYRSAVELARTHLGLERCGLLLVEGQQMVGTYGTDRHGHTTDEREHSFVPTSTMCWSTHIEKLRQGASGWFYCPDEQLFERGLTPDSRLGRGWIALTPIRQNGKLLAVFSNDAFVSGAPCDAAQQEALVIYGSLLGSIMARIQSGEQWRALVGVATDHLWAVAPDGTLRSIHPQPESDSPTGLSAFDLVHPEDHASLREALDVVLGGTEDLAQCEVRFHEPGGALRWCAARVGRFSGNGRTPAAVLLITDITDRKSTEEALVAHQDRLRSLASELALAEERERRRLARELHDGATQDLALTRLRLAMLRAEVHHDKGKQAVDEMDKLLSNAILHTRMLTFELSPPLLYELGIDPALQWLAEQFKEKHGLDCSAVCDSQSTPLEPEDRVALFQSVRELLNNVAKHAKARHVNILSACDDQHIRIDVTDDGVGFDPDAVAPPSPKEGHFGLFNLRERMAGLGGVCVVRSEPGSGCTVTLRLPLKRGDHCDTNGGNAP